MFYQSSKAALNMIADRYAAALPSVRVTTVDPGYTATDLNAHRSTRTVTEGTTRRGPATGTAPTRKPRRLPPRPRPASSPTQFLRRHEFRCEAEPLPPGGRYRVHGATCIVPNPRATMSC